MEITEIDVRLDSLADIMFDRFIDHSKDERPPEQKLYLFRGNKLVLPAENIVSFLFGDDPPGCAKAFEGKKGKEYIRAGLGHVFINPVFIPFLRDEKEVIFKGFDVDYMYLHEGSGRTKQGSRSIKQPMKKRPVFCHPWSLEFKISVVKNSFIDETKLYNWFVRGGILISIGTYRPRFGRFEIAGWEPSILKEKKKSDRKK